MEWVLLFTALNVNVFILGVDSLTTKTAKTMITTELMMMMMMMMMKKKKRMRGRRGPRAMAESPLRCRENLREHGRTRTDLGTRSTLLRMRSNMRFESVGRRGQPFTIYICVSITCLFPQSPSIDPWRGLECAYCDIVNLATTCRSQSQYVFCLNCP